MAMTQRFRRRRAGWAVPAATILLLAAPNGAAGPAVAQTAPAVVTVNSGVDGGGFINVIGVRNTTMIAGGDTQGLFRTTAAAGPLGARWAPVSAGLRQPWSRHIAAVLPVGGSGATTTWLAAAGDGTAGGVIVSTDDGVSWTTIAAGAPGGPPVFDGNNLPDQQRDHPRATGGLLLAVPRAGGGPPVVYAASSAGGLQQWRGSASTPDGLRSGWRAVTTANALPSTLVALAGTRPDPNGPTTLFVVDRPDPASPGGAGRVHRITVAADDVTATRHTFGGSAPTGMQELALVGTHLYAAGLNGLWACGNCLDAPGEGNWTQLSARAALYTVAGRATAAGDVVWAGAAASPTTADQSTQLVKVQVAWSGARPTNPLPPVTGLTGFDAPASGWSPLGGGPAWWLSTSARAMMPGRGSYVASALAFTAEGTFVAGRSGVWRVTGAGTSATDWSPAVRGLAVTFDNALAVRGGTGSTVGVGDTDWSFLGSTDGLASVSRQPNEQLQMAFDLVWDAAGAVLATGSRDCNKGAAIRVSSQPLTGATRVDWSSVPLPAGAGRPLAIATDGAGQPMLAAFETGTLPGADCGQQATGGGVYQRSAAGAWSAMPGAPSVNVADPQGAALVVDPGGVNAWLYVRSSGLWRSTRQAKTESWGGWQPLPGVATAEGSGWLAINPKAPTRLWLATAQGGLRFLPNAAACSPDPAAATSCRPGPAATVDGTPSGATIKGGPVGALADGSDGNVYLASPATTASPAALWRVAPPAGPAVAARATRLTPDDGYYANASLSPTVLVVTTGPAGARTVHVATAGNGVSTTTVG